MNTNFDAFVPGSRKNIISRGEEGDRGHIVVMSMEGLGAFIRGEVPQFDGHVGTAGHWTQMGQFRSFHFVQCMQY